MLSCPHQYRLLLARIPHVPECCGILVPVFVKDIPGFVAGVVLNRNVSSTASNLDLMQRGKRGTLRKIGIWTLQSRV
jgi:hypothetical protein